MVPADRPPTEGPLRDGPERVAVLATPGVVPFSLSVPGQVFAGPAPREQGLYALTVCSAEGRVQTSDGYEIHTEHGLEALADADLIMLPGPAAPPDEVPVAVVEAVCDAHRRGARIASLCTGAFVLAATGLLSGRRVSTHWLHADELSARCPGALVERDVLFCVDGRVLSSAGLAAGIDQCLHIVARTHGAEMAGRCARYLVAAPHRSGGQAQYIEYPMPEVRQSPMGDTRAWMLDHLADDLTVDVLAAHARMSRRTFTRQFRAETGQSPTHWLLHQRLIRARLLLETTTDPVPVVARRTGMGTDAALRHHFRRTLGVTPTQYRHTFAGPA